MGKQGVLRVGGLAVKVLTAYKNRWRPPYGG